MNFISVFCIIRSNLQCAASLVGHRIICANLISEVQRIKFILKCTSFLAGHIKLYCLSIPVMVFTFDWVNDTLS